MSASSRIHPLGVGHGINIVSPESSPAKTAISEHEDVETDDDLPLKEISFDSSQAQEEFCDLGCGEISYTPKVLEFWKVDRIPACATCGLDDKDVELGFDIDNLCGIVTGSSQSVAPETGIMARKSKGIIKNMQYPSFLKVEKVDPVKSGFIVPPQSRGRVCSLSRAVSKLDSVVDKQPLQPSAKQRNRQKKDKLQENSRESTLDRVQSLHLEVAPVDKYDTENPTVIAREEQAACREKKVDFPKPRFVHDRIRLPIRAGRNKSSGGSNAKNKDGQDLSRESSSSFAPPNSSHIDGHRSNNEDHSHSTFPHKARINLLPVRAGRVNKSHQGASTIDIIPTDDDHPINHSQHPRRGFIERRQCLIAAAKTHNETDSYPNATNWFDNGRIEIVQETAIENCSDIDTMKWDNKNKHHRNGQINSKLFCSESKASQSNTSSSNVTSEETLEDESDESSSVFDNKREDKGTITKAGWITRHLGKNGVIDSMDGVQNIELVYTPFLS